MVFSGGLPAGDELHSQGLCLVSEIVQDPLAIVFFKAVLRPVGVFLAIGEHGVDQARQLVSCSHSIVAHSSEPIGAALVSSLFGL